MYQGADPSVGWGMTDPIYGKVPTLGACMPNIRRAVERGDYIFSISGRVINVKPHVVGTFSVDAKIDALAAYQRFPGNRMIIDKDGKFRGNIIVDENGNHLEYDYHTNHQKRVENYIIGKDPIFFEKEEQIKRAKEETLYVLNNLFNKNEPSVSKVIGRWRKLDHAQVNDLLRWMNQISQI